MQTRCRVGQFAGSTSVRLREFPRTPDGFPANSFLPASHQLSDGNPHDRRKPFARLNLVSAKAGSRTARTRRRLLGGGSGAKTEAIRFSCVKNESRLPWPA